LDVIKDRVSVVRGGPTPHEVANHGERDPCYFVGSDGRVGIGDFPKAGGYDP
jgi:hypothetical protein